MDKNIPKHIAIILDGNRRFAKKLMLEPWKGHEFGSKKVTNLLEWCVELNIKELTLYAFSLQNFNRPKQEFDYLMKLFKDFAQQFLDDPKVDANKIGVRIIGRYTMFPKDVVELLEKIMNKTKNYNNLIVNVAMAYGGREEIIDGIKNILTQYSKNPFNINDIDEKFVVEHLHLKSDPDLIIRTGGEQRISNFLPWQSIYSELFFKIGRAHV